MRLHNELSITLGDKTYTAYNNVLKNSLIDKLRNLDDWFGVIAFGSGKNETTSSTTTLTNFISAKELTLTSHSFDPSKVMHAEKHCYFSEEDMTEITFSEVGIGESVAGASNEIYSRFLIKDDMGSVIDITRHAGEKMDICVKCFLTIDENSNINLTKGENILVRCMLGCGDLSADEKVFRVYGADDASLNNLIVDRSSLNGLPGGDNFINQTVTDDEIFDLSANLTENNIIEAIFTLNNQVFARYNVSTESVVTESTTGTSSNTIVFSSPYVTDILEIYNVTDDTIYLTFNESKFTLNFGQMQAYPFDITFDSNYTLIESNDGRRVGFYGDSNFYMYHSFMGKLYRVNTDDLVIRQNTQKIFIRSSYVFVWYNLNGASKIDAYYEDNLKLVQVELDHSKKFPTGFPLFLSLEINVIKSGAFHFCYLTSIPGNAFVISSSIDSLTHKITLGSSLGKSTAAYITKIFPVACYQTYESYFMLLFENGSTNYFIKSNGTTFGSKLNDTSKTYIVPKRSTCFPFGAWLGAYSNDHTLLMYNNRKSSTIGYAYSHDNIQKVYGSRCGKYIADFDSSNIYMSYILEHNDLKTFSAAFSYSGFTISALIPLADVLLVKTVESPYYKVISLPEIYTKVSASSCSGDSINLTYKVASPASVNAINLCLELK